MPPEPTPMCPCRGLDHHLAHVVHVEVSVVWNRMSKRPSEHQGLAYPCEQFIL